MKASIQVFTLGGLRFTNQNKTLSNLGSRKAEALVVYLVSIKKQQSREVLADLLWDERPQAQALGNLRVILNILRKRFLPIIVINRRSVRLNPEAEIWYDVHAFQDGLKAIQESGEITNKNADETRQALAHYRGEFLEGFYIREGHGFDQWMVQERERLHQLAISAYSDLTNYFLKNGDYPAGIAHATRLLELHPLLESAHRQMMQLLAFSGKRDLALKQYETLRQAQADELAIEPDEESKQLFKDIQSGQFPGTPPQPAGAQMLSSRPRHNLPASLTPLIGRESELVRIELLLEDPDCRLVTLVGPGGVGKTRLAIRTAERILARFPHGAWFVRLDPLNSSEFMAEAIAAAMKLTFSGQKPPAEQLVEYLSHRELLLVLDNFEHLLPDGTGLILYILRKAPKVMILVTSREVLNLFSEWIFEVHGLVYPEDGILVEEADYPAIDLFIHHARRVTGKPLVDKDLIDISRITRAVEGMPLALELAVTWTRALTYPEVAEGIERGLGILRTKQADLPERQHSMRAVFDHSWQMLSEEEQAVIARLSVFRGGFDSQSATFVAQASVGILSSLVNKSLLYRDSGGRYRIHELLRQYAAEELERAGETETTQERHLAYFLDLAEQAEPQLWRDQEIAWLNRLETEHDNLRAALERSFSAKSIIGVQGGLKLVLALDQFWRFFGRYQEAINLLDSFLSHPHVFDHPIILANGLRLAAFYGMWWSGTREIICQKFEISLKIAEEEGDELLLAWVLSDFVIYYLNTNVHLNLAKEYQERSLRIFQKLRYEPGIAKSLSRLGQLARDHRNRLDYYRESLQVWKRLGRKSGIAFGLYQLGLELAHSGLYREAQDYLEESLALYRELNPNYIEPEIMLQFGWFYFVTGDFARAITFFEEVKEISVNFGKKTHVARALFFFGMVHLYIEDYLIALSYQQEALEIMNEAGGEPYNKSAILFGLGVIHSRLEDQQRAWNFFKAALMLIFDTNFRDIGAIVMIGLADLWNSAGNPWHAAKLLGAAEASFELNTPPFPYYPGPYADFKRILRSLREQLEEDRFELLINQGRAMLDEGMAKAIEFALQIGPPRQEVEKYTVI